MKTPSTGKEAAEACIAQFLTKLEADAKLLSEAYRNTDVMMVPVDWVVDGVRSLLGKTPRPSREAQLSQALRRMETTLLLTPTDLELLQALEAGKGLALAEQISHIYGTLMILQSTLYEFHFPDRLNADLEDLRKLSSYLNQRFTYQS